MLYEDNARGLPGDDALSQWMTGRAAASDGTLGAALLLRLLDEIDYGLLLLDDAGEVRLANRQARLECDAPEAPLRRVGHQLQATHAGDAASLRAALAGARQGRRCLLALGALHVAVVPLDDPAGGARMALLVFGKRLVCELSVEMFAGVHGLTPAEAKVLRALCGGARPAGIAHEFGVAVSTVRTQLASLREKTQAASIRDVVRKVAVLPPVLCVLRAESAALH